MENKKIAVEFTKKQFFALMKAVYLGNWMANAQREENFKEDYEKIKHYVFSQASKFDLDEFVSHEKTDGDKYYSTWKFEEETDVDYLHDEYDEENFWDEICDRLAERDFEREFSKKEIERMSADERMDKFYRHVEKWENELNAHGIDRLEIKK